MEVIWGKVREKAHEELNDATEYRKMSEEMHRAGEHKCAALLSDIADEEEVHMRHLTDMLAEKSCPEVVLSQEVHSENPMNTAF